MQGFFVTGPFDDGDPVTGHYYGMASSDPSRPQVWGFFLSTAIMALLAFVFFYPDNIDGNTLRQADMLQGAANGHEAQVFVTRGLGGVPRLFNHPQVAVLTLHCE